MGYEAKSPHTKAYEKYLLLQLVHATIADVSIKEEMGDKALEGIVNRWISTEVKWAEVKKVKVLGLDEIALKKGHRDFVVIVTGRLATGSSPGPVRRVSLAAVEWSRCDRRSRSSAPRSPWIPLDRSRDPA